MKTNLLTLMCVIALIALGCKKTDLKQSTQSSQTLKRNNAVWSISNVLTDSMVVQRGKQFKVWGTTPTGHTIKVQASWDGNTDRTATVDGSGNWTATVIATPAATTTPQTLKVYDNGVLVKTFNQILIGDVWICAGQSNMNYPMYPETFWGFPGVENYAAESNSADVYTNVRLLNVPPYDPASVQDQLNPTYPPRWMKCNRTNVRKFSAVAYYFGGILNYSLGSSVPVGIIASSIANTSCQQWMQYETLNKHDGIYGTSYHTQSNVSKLYNGMIHPLRKLPIKGFVWYQGESNVSDYANYKDLNNSLIYSWRGAFGNNSLPFHFVQLAPWFTYDLVHMLREQQAKMVSDTGSKSMAVTMDLAASSWDIHPPYKKQIGQRLALLALNKTYGATIYPCLGPKYASFSQAANSTTVTVNFTEATGLTSKDRDGNTVSISQCFKVAKADKVFQNATATISGTSIILTVPANFPVASIRYAFGQAYNTTLRNSSGLPMEPFRTDNW